MELSIITRTHRQIGLFKDRLYKEDKCIYTSIHKIIPRKYTIFNIFTTVTQSIIVTATAQYREHSQTSDFHSEQTGTVFF